MEREQVVLLLLKAAGGRLDGRVRFQKTAYLLDRLGLESGFRYEYGNFGPFSRELNNAVEDAKAFGLLKEEIGRRKVDGAHFSIFKLTTDHLELPSKMGDLTKVMLESYLQTFAETHITVLELAALANWLSEEEERSDWKETLRCRKGPKVEGGKLGRALDLLRELGLRPATANVRDQAQPHAP